jgi:type I restriction-modification system DNA methylase subunit
MGGRILRAYHQNEKENQETLRRQRHRSLKKEKTTMEETIQSSAEKTKASCAISNYHDALFNAGVSDDKKLNLTSLIAFLFTENYKNFRADFKTALYDDTKQKTYLQKLIDLGCECIDFVQPDESFKEKIKTAWTSLSDQTKLNDSNPDKGINIPNIFNIINVFVEECGQFFYRDGASVKSDFMGQLFAEINGKGAKGKTGIVLTPFFATKTMVDLIDLDYRKDVIIDGACGSGSFLVTACVKMLNDIENDRQSGKITAEEAERYQNRIGDSAIFGNDNEPRMCLFCLINFLLLGINIKNITCGDFFALDESFFKEKQINKGLLNPPYELDPAHFCSQLAGLLHGVESEHPEKDYKMAIIMPPQSFNKKDGWLYKTLSVAKLDAIIKTQSDIFVESNVSFPASIFLFNLSRGQKNDDDVTYCDFTESGFHYFKDSGLIDKESTFAQKEKTLIEKIKAKSILDASFKHDFSNFYAVQPSDEMIVKLDVQKIQALDPEECDLTVENQIIKKAIADKKSLVANGAQKTKTDEIDAYMIGILSETEEK